MKTASYLTIAAVVLAFASLIVPIGTQAETADKPVASPGTLISLLAAGDIVSLRVANATHEIVLLDDESVRSFRASFDSMKAAAETAKAAKNQSRDDGDLRNEGLQSGWHQLSTPWKVVQIGKDYVRLEPLEQVPDHEKVTWIAIAQDSIGHIKSRK